MRATLLCVVLALSGCDRGDDAWCDGDVAHRCGESRAGEFCEETNCADEQKACVEAYDHVPVALCVADPVQRPQCTDATDSDGYFFRCDGAELLTCVHGYARDITDCGDASLCISGIADCLVHAGVDPMCASGRYSYCDGDTLIAKSGVVEAGAEATNVR